MFTGIVEETGEVVAVSRTKAGTRLRVRTSFAPELTRGQSIAVSGVCLTVEEREEDGFEVFLSRETLDRTYLDAVTEGNRVNLERAVPADGRFDGHFVQGHVDGTAELRAVDRTGNDGDDREYTFALPSDLRRYVVEKGSIAVDGISLTVAELGGGEFSVAVVPETYRLTNLSGKALGDPVHLEVDLVAKYVERLTVSDHD